MNSLASSHPFLSQYHGWEESLNPGGPRRYPGDFSRNRNSQTSPHPSPLWYHHGSSRTLRRLRHQFLRRHSWRIRKLSRLNQEKIALLSSTFLGVPDHRAAVGLSSKVEPLMATHFQPRTFLKLLCHGALFMLRPAQRCFRASCVTARAHLMCTRRCAPRLAPCTSRFGDLSNPTPLAESGN